MRGRYIPAHICQALLHSRRSALMIFNRRLLDIVHRSTNRAFPNTLSNSRVKPHLKKKKKKTIDPPTDRTVDVFFLANIRTCNYFLFTAHTTHYIPFPLSSYFDFFSMTSLTRVVASFTSLYHHRLVSR